MARPGWGTSIATATGVAAATGAAQLGFGYGLGIINWTPAGASAAEAAWVSSLAWTIWISATSVVAGAVCAQRLHEPPAEDETPTRRRLTLAVAGSAGALITVLLLAVPARAASVPGTASPQTVAAGYAAAGLVIGALLAAWALHSRAAATNLVATGGWLWLLAVVSVAGGVVSGRDLTSVQLGHWQITTTGGPFWLGDYLYWPGAVLSMGSALVIGALAARRAARLAERRIEAAASGAAGPLLVALAYLLTVPRLAAVTAEQVSAHLIVPYALIAGVGGSVLVAALAQRADRRATAPAGVSVPGQRTGEPDDLPTGRPRRDGEPPAGNGPGTLDEPAVPPTGPAGRRATAAGAGVSRGGEATVAVAEAERTGPGPETTIEGPAAGGGTAGKRVIDRPAGDGPPAPPAGPKARTQRRGR